MKSTDQKYIDALLNNDIKILEELYEKFADKIKWMVLQNHGTATDAADIFQESVFAIYHKARKREFILTSSFDAFFYAVCKNKWLKQLHKRKHNNIVKDWDDNNLGEDSFKLAEELNLQEERKNLLRQKLTELDNGCKELLRLSWSSRSMEEVAKKLGFTYAYVRKKKSECMSKLVRLVKQSQQYNALKR